MLITHDVISIYMHAKAHMSCILDDKTALQNSCQPPAITAEEFGMSLGIGEE